MLRPEITKNAKRTLSQLVREFWLQFIIGICWALYRVKIADGELISVFIANFSVSFFLASWLWGQVIRVRRQQRVEDEFQHVKSELQKLLGSLEKQTQHLIGHTTGGDSVGYFSPTFFSKDQLDFMFLNVSQYPVFDVFAEWIDLDEKTDFENKKFWTRNRINLGTVHPNKATLGVFGFDMSQRSRLRINIFIQTRNSGLTQQIHVAKANGQWKIAIETKSERFNETKIPADFPGYIAEDPSKVFSV